MTGGPIPEVLSRCFASFDRGDVRWCLLREMPEEQYQAGDIDVLVGVGQLDAACRIAIAAGFVSVPGHSHGRNLLTFSAAARRWLWLHLVDELSFGPFYRLQSHLEEVCLARAEASADLRRLNPADEFWVTLVHCLLDKGVITPKHRDRLQLLAAAAGDGGPLQSLLMSVSAPARSPERLLEWVRLGDWATLEQCGSALRQEWLARGPVRPSPGWIPRVRGAVGYRLRGWRRRGISVALLGPDGAGKTTVATTVVAGFALPARRVYMGLTGGAMRFVQRIRIPGLVLAGQLTVLWSRCLYAVALKSRGYLVVFDRYAYDAVAPTPVRLSAMRRMSRWIAGHSCPRPDLILVLNAPGAVMYGRKGAYTAQQLDDWRRHFLRLVTRFPNVTVIDTDRPLEQVRADVFDCIWRRYAERWR